jgi:hypothetical protein
MSPKMSPKASPNRRRRQPPPPPHVRIDAGVTVAVIRLALFRIGQHLVGFFDFLEFLFRVLAVRIAVRMVLHRQFAIGLLDLVFDALLATPSTS